MAGISFIGKWRACDRRAARRHGGTAARRHGGTAARRHGGTAARAELFPIRVVVSTATDRHAGARRLRDAVFAPPTDRLN
ncbi:hypothetical protein DF057_35965 [Burkholderia cepacia]|nr:hypothetical protein DF057_35965 [Burkholderia cepacia]